MHLLARHRAVLDAYETSDHEWLLPWAILPEVDYLVSTRLGARVHRAWLDDLAEGSLFVEWGRDDDLAASATVRDEQRVRAGTGGSLVEDR